VAEGSDFNAIRIALASPEQIRAWSYGEVTKPETINYRTLKPEKDGLFCERIFGPTKDFECYCGKYKRVRYKGIVCDKCGVEVARSKVRRERMGHIELAAPVAHIWYVKGSPSRIGLLLDISPRSLEQILYFARYTITYVDEEGRKQAVSDLHNRLEQELADRERALSESMAQATHEGEEAIQELEAGSHREVALLDEELERRLQELEGPEAGGALEEEHARKRQDLLLKAEEAAEAQRSATMAQVAALQRKLQEEQEQLKAHYNALAQDLDELQDPVANDKITILTESRCQELSERWGEILRAGMGAEALLEILERLDLDHLYQKLREEVQGAGGQRRKKAIKRLRIVDAYRKSGNRPQWMIMQVLPVMPPDLRPMVQLDGGRFATSDLNDLYRRVINRNNRLKRLLELGAPDIIIRNEKRMLQEAVDSLIDNGRRGRAVTIGNNHRLKSLSDMMRGKQGRFRQNLLGKRVDYSGRSVIVVGPELKLHQCGLPKRMALELFKPFVMRALVSRGLAHNIKSAKRQVERARPEVWDILEEVIHERPVLLNRAPTLHRLGIQAFEPILIEGNAIQIHPLVCAAYNADFDGDQMAVHVPLSLASVAEARQVLLSTHNILLPSNGEPVVAPTLDIVLGCYYLTMEKPGAKGSYLPVPGLPAQGVYGSFQDACLARDIGLLDLQATIRVRDKRTEGQWIETSVGRIIFNEVVPPELGFYNQVMDKKALKELVTKAYELLQEEKTEEMLDRIKGLGFHYATESGITIGIHDLEEPESKARIVAEADARVRQINEQYQLGLITDEERYDQTVQIWQEVFDRMQEEVAKAIDRYGSVSMMAASGAKGNISQITQMAAMRGLMSDPSGRIIELPILSSFRDGLSVLEYFISTHGARKGLADTALRTADSGYLTRRLVDVSQDVVVMEDDCGTTAGIWVKRPTDPGALATLKDRVFGRCAASPIVDPATGRVLAERSQEINEEIATAIEDSALDRVHVRSPLTCLTRRGVCQLCYGWDPAYRRLVNHRTAVGIIAAQSIGEPGTQLTMRTFHTGGIAGVDITSGLPRVEELFEARIPRGHAVIAEIGGYADIRREGDLRHIKIQSSELYREDYPVSPGDQVVVSPQDFVEQGAVLIRTPEEKEVKANIAGQVLLERSDRLSILYEEREEREYIVPITARLRVENGQYVRAGELLTEGPANPQDILRIKGREAVQEYLVEEVQKVYSSQGVDINNKHIEAIIRQMLRKVQVDNPGDTSFLPGELVDRFQYEDVNAKILAEGGEPATAQAVLLGITKASLNTESFLAAASFQETTRVLTEAAINGAIDRLHGLKENVIIGRLIPARAPIALPPPIEPAMPSREQMFLGEGIPPSWLEEARGGNGASLSSGLEGESEDEAL